MALDISPPLTFYAFKRTGASWAFKQGVPLEHIMKHDTWMSDAIWSYLSPPFSHFPYFPCFLDRSTFLILLGFGVPRNSSISPNYLIFFNNMLTCSYKHSVVYKQHPYFPPPISKSNITVKHSRLPPPHTTRVCPWFSAFPFVSSLTFLSSKVTANCWTFGFPLWLYSVRW